MIRALTPERWQELKELVASALAMPEAEREGFVRGRASQDPELCGQAISLLASADLAESFLSAPALDLASSILDSIAEEHRAPIPRGARFGPYEILTLVGAGGMGEVYRARDERLKREVAVKVLPLAFTRNPDRLRRFEQEARAAGALNHPNILAIHDVGSQEGTPYVVSELLEGETLRQRLQSGALPARKAIDYAVQVARGLAAAHEKGIVHRDLKPENLFVTKDGRIKILDFGLAKITRPDMSSLRASAIPTTPAGTEPGVVMGTVGYMSPEQVRGEATDARSDIFSLGAILYEMLSGKRAFRGDSAAETMAAILKEEPAELSTTGKSIPPGLERVVRHCLEKSREERFHSARDLAFDLEVLSGVSGQSLATTPIAGRRSVRRSAPILGAAALTLIAAGLIGAWIASRTRQNLIPQFHQLTFRRGYLLNARFAPDGRTVVYSAGWEGQPSEIFTVRTDSEESRSVGLVNARLLSVSSKGELAVLLLKNGQAPFLGTGTLARVPIGGGTPRAILEEVYDADWAPDGEQLAVLRHLPSGKSRIEYPIGTALYEGIIDELRVSPKGDLVAFYEQSANGTYSVSTVDRRGKRTIVSGGWIGSGYVLWSPNGDELIVTNGRTRDEWPILGISLSGRERPLLPISPLDLYDVAPDGRLLGHQTTERLGMRCQGRGENRARELSWLNGSRVSDISDDGTSLIFTEYYQSPRPKYGVFLRRTDASPAVRLGDGRPQKLSEDGRWVLTVTGQPRVRLVLLPTGVGSVKEIPTGGFEPIDAYLVPNDKGFVFTAQQADGVVDLFAVGPNGGNPRSLHPEGFVAEGQVVFSPDGGTFAYCSKSGQLKSGAFAGGETRTLPGPPLEEGGQLLQWSSDGRFLFFVRRLGDVPTLIDRQELATGRREPWKRLELEDPVGVRHIRPVVIAPDGESYAYTYIKLLADDLYVVEGVR